MKRADEVEQQMHKVHDELEVLVTMGACHCKMCALGDIAATHAIGEAGFEAMLYDDEVIKEYSLAIAKVVARTLWDMRQHVSLEAAKAMDAMAPDADRKGASGIIH